MICFPNAKINIGLKIISKRPDGYHNLETIFYPVNLCDALECIPSKNNKNTLNISGEILENDSTEKNLVTKAYETIKQRYDIAPVDVYLHKNIPVGAGLGGGSSDAAYMLKLINDFNKLKLTGDTLEKYASGIGADCAFFIKNTPATAKGIGDILKTINLSLKGYYIVLVKPNIFISTAEAYSGVTPKKSETSLEEMILQPIETWKESIKNDFEPGIFDKYPEIEKIKNELYNQGALYASMSGSGSAVYGIFKEKTDLKHMFSNCFYWNKEL